MSSGSISEKKRKNKDSAFVTKSEMYKEAINENLKEN